MPTPDASNDSEPAVAKNLDMDSMTMVFQVADPGMLAKVKAGDKAKFEADLVNGAIMGRDEVRHFMVRPFRTEIGI